MHRNVARTDETRRRHRGVKAGLAAVGVLAAFVLISLGGSQANAQVACTTEWESAVDGFWSEADKWTNGVPVTGSTACIRVDDASYTVLYISAQQAPSYLLVGGSNNTQTLRVVGTNICPGGAAELKAGDVDVTANGVVDLTGDGNCDNGSPQVLLRVGTFSGETGWSNGTLTNFGTVKTSGNCQFNERTIEGDVLNQGLFDLDCQTHHNSPITAAATFFNLGQIDIANGIDLRQPNFFWGTQPEATDVTLTFTNGVGGSINAAGTGQLFSDTGNVFNQAGGSATGTEPILLRNVALNYSAPGASKITVHGTVPLTGDIGADETLIVEGRAFRSHVNQCADPEHAVLTANQSFASAGDIILTSEADLDGGCGNEYAMLDVTSGTLTNTGTIRSELGQGHPTASQRYLRGNVTNGAGGVLDVDRSLRFDDPASTFMNNGDLNVADAHSLTVPAGTGATFTNGTGGSIDVTGSGVLFLDTGNTFNQGDGTTSGNVPVLLRSSALNYTGTGASKILVRGAGATLSGNIGSDQDLIVEGRAPTAANFCFDPEPATLSANQSFTNDGDIILTSTAAPGCGGEYAMLEVTTGTLTNSGKVLSEPGQASPNAQRYLRGNVANGAEGTLEVDRSLHLDGAGATHTNAGDITIAAGSTLFEDSGTLTQTGGSIALEASTSGLSATTLELQGGSLSGPGTVSAAVNNTGGTVSPGASPGILTVSGNFTQGAGGTLAVEIGGTTAGNQYDRLAVSGAAALDGTLAISRINNFVAATTDTFTILTHASRTGTFSSVTGTDAGNGGTFVAEYGSTETKLSVDPPVQHTLTVAKNGTGSGTVSSGDGEITCGADCSHTYNDGTTVVLTASPVAGSSFGGWTNCSSPSANQCTEVIGSDKTVTATFNALPNLIKNGGFELDSNGDLRPDNWTRKANFTRRSTVKFSGNFAGRHRSTGNVSYTIQQTIANLVAGTTYQFSGRVNVQPTGDNFTLTLQVRWRNSSNNVLRTDVVKQYTKANANGAWDQATASLVAPPGATKAQVRMRVKNLNATIYVDDFMLTA